jgi:hypothetical protein
VDLKLNPNKLTIGWMRAFKAASGIDFNPGLVTEGLISNWDVMLGLVYATEHSTNPDFTIADAEAVPITSINLITEEDENPPMAATPSSKRKRPSSTSSPA